MVRKRSTREKTRNSCVLLIRTLQEKGFCGRAGRRLEVDIQVPSVNARIGSNWWKPVQRKTFTKTVMGMSFFFWSCFTFPKHPYWLWDPTQLHIQWVPETLSQVLMRPERECDKLSPFNVEIRNKQSFISLSCIRHRREKGQFYFKICKSTC